MQVVVFGAGSLGSLIGGLLARVHDVTLVGRNPHVQAIERDGLRITGELAFEVTPTAVTSIAAPAADLAVVTVKAYDTASAAESLAGGELGAVLSLQNGLGNEAILERIGAPVLAGVTSYGALRDGPGTVECTGVGDVTLGPHNAPDELARAVGSAFDAADIETSVRPDIRPALWEKLAINAAINPPTALADVPNGAVLDRPLWPIAERAAIEVAATARECELDLPNDRVVERLRTVADATADNVSSMRADLNAHRRTEIDAITGAVLDRADRDRPVNAVLAALVRAHEAGLGLR